MLESDLRWFWAAYRLGAFPNMEPGLGQPEFVDTLVERLDQEVTQVIVSMTSKGEAPVALLGARAHEYWVEPRFTWMPWASVRNKLEGALKVLAEGRKRGTLMIICPESDERFWEHIKKYGIMKWMGKLKGEGQDLTFYHTRRMR